MNPGQVYETAIAYGELPTYQSGMKNDFSKIKCLVGMIEEVLREFV